MPVGSSVKPMAFVNILFSGLIGAGVNPLIGAACEHLNLTASQRAVPIQSKLIPLDRII